jgi:colicin import membrane protein
MNLCPNRRPFSGADLTALLLALASLACHDIAGAQDPGSVVVERRRIDEQQAQARALFAQEERECQARFAVTACVDDVRQRHRDAMASLKRQAIVLDDAERRERAALRAQAIRDRISAEEARQRQPIGAPREPRATPSIAPIETQGKPPTARPASSQRGTSDPQRQAREARSRATFDASQAEAREHREAAERRAAQRQKNRRPAAPLPTPSAPAR